MQVPETWATFPLHAIHDGKCGCGDDTCDRIGKHPRVRWSQVKAGEQNHEPGQPYGVCTGARSNVIVLDFDDMEALERFEKERPMPGTFMVRTGRGCHVYYQWPRFPVRNSVSELADHVDVRGDGGFVVGPGSPHKNGRTYNAIDPWDVFPAAPCPQWLLDWPGLKQLYVEHKEPTGNAPIPVDLNTPRGVETLNLARDYLRSVSPCISGQNGQGQLWAVALRLIRYYLLSVDDALALLQEPGGYNGRCIPPWNDYDIMHKLTEARDRSDLPPGGADVAGFLSNNPLPRDLPIATEYTFDPLNTRRLTKDKLVKLDYSYLVHYLANDQEWKHVFRKNEYDGRIYATRPPMRLAAEKGVSRFEGTDVGSIRIMLEWQDGTAKTEDISSAVHQVAEGRTYNPIVDWLQSLPQEDTNHLDHLAARLFGDSSPQAQVALRNALIASVARAVQPGCKVDTVLTLIGPGGGEKKSTAIEALYQVHGCSTFRSDLPDIRDMQKAGQALEGVWAVELAELDIVKKSDENTLKSFLTRRVERYSPKYVAGEVTRPRRCVFWATTNDEQFLPRYDRAFRRRFQVIRMGKTVDLNDLETIREQVWAEAYALYLAGTPWWTEDESKADEGKDAYMLEDAWLEPIHALLAKLQPLKDEGGNPVPIRFLSANGVFRMMPGNQERNPTDQDIKKVHRVMRATGLEIKTRRGVRGYLLPYQISSKGALPLIPAHQTSTD